MEVAKLNTVLKFKFPFEGKNLSGKIVLLVKEARNTEIRNSMDKYTPAEEEHLQAYKDFCRYNSLGNIAAIGTEDVEGQGKAVWVPKKGIVTTGNLITVPSHEYWKEGTLFLLVKKVA